MTDTFEQMPESIAAHIVYRLLTKDINRRGMMFEQFEEALLSGGWPSWNQAVAEIADAMREHASQAVKDLRDEIAVLEELHDEIVSGAKAARKLDSIRGGTF